MKNAILMVAAVAAGAGVGPQTARAQSSLFGNWKIVDAEPAPWIQSTERAALTAEGKRALNSEVAFSSGVVKSKFQPFDCKRKVLYSANAIEVDALFQGNLPEPNPAAAAARLGFPRSGEVPGVDVRCLKAQFTFHFRDANTALINYNRIIYTLKRD